MPNDINRAWNWKQVIPTSVPQINGVQKQVWEDMNRVLKDSWAFYAISLDTIASALKRCKWNKELETYINDNYRLIATTLNRIEFDNQMEAEQRDFLKNKVKWLGIEHLLLAQSIRFGKIVVKDPLYTDGVDFVTPEWKIFLKKQSVHWKPSKKVWEEKDISLRPSVDSVIFPPHKTSGMTTLH
jgi:hypothetical protein